MNYEGYAIGEEVWSAHENNGYYSFQKGIITEVNFLKENGKIIAEYWIESDGEAWDEPSANVDKDPIRLFKRLILGE